MSALPIVGTPRSPRPAGANFASKVAAIMAEADRLAQLDGADRLIREAVEFARESLGIERVSIFLSQPAAGHVVMRGTWGTNHSRRTTDEHSLAHACSHEDFLALGDLHRRGALWQFLDLERHETDRQRLPWKREDRPWLAITPLVAASEVVGVIYNDTAITNAPLDSATQTNLAVFGSLLAGLAHERRTRRADVDNDPVVTKTTRSIEKVLSALESDPGITGELLAQRLRISPGHLARLFKQEVGCSLVEYRNRLRLERFFALTRAGQHNLLEAALAAGFGSYAQFHRVHRRVTGSAPRHYAASGQRPSRPTQAG